MSNICFFFVYLLLYSELDQYTVDNNFSSYHILLTLYLHFNAHLQPAAL